MSIINWLKKKGFFYHLVYDAELRINYGVLDELLPNYSLFREAPTITITAASGRIKLTYPQKFYDWDNKVFPLFDNSMSPFAVEHSSAYFPFVAYHSDNRSITLTYYNASDLLDLTAVASFLLKFKFLAQSKYPNKFLTYY